MFDDAPQEFNLAGVLIYGAPICLLQRLHAELQKERKVEIHGFQSLPTRAVAAGKVTSHFSSPPLFVLEGASFERRQVE